jgi:hypothetical protein
MSQKTKNILLIVSLCFISFFAGFALKPKTKTIEKTNQYQVASPTQSPITIANQEDISKQLSEIKDELAKIRAEQRGINQVLGAADKGSIKEFTEALENLKSINEENQPSPTPLGYVKTNSSQFNSVDIYQSPSFSSTVIGQMENAKSYPFSEKNNNWYQIEMATGTKGYVNAKFVIEETIKVLQ